jgi:hypothetical protein
MATLHFLLITIAQYGLFIGIRKLDSDHLVRPRVDGPVWSYASWGAAVYFEFKPLSFLAWGWVSRFRFDRFLAARFPAKIQGGPPSAAHVVIRAVLGFITGLVLVVIFLALLTLLEFVLSDVLDLPPYLPGQR